MNDAALETRATSSPSTPSEQAMPLLRVVAVGLLFGAVASLLAVSDRMPWQHPAPAAQASAPSSTTVAAALGSAPRTTAESPRIVTTSGEVTAKGVAAIVDTLRNNGPVADPGGAFPKPRAGSLFHRMVDGDMTLRVYTVPGTPEAVMTAYGKELESAGFHRDEDPGKGAKADKGEKADKGDKSDQEESAKADPRGRIRRIFSKKNVEALISVSRTQGEHGPEALVTIVEQPKRDEP